MSNAAILHGKHAVVFGAGGSIGAEVAREFAAEGALAFLAGRSKANVEAVAKQITECGGEAQISVIDTLNDAAVNDYITGIVNQRGNIDILLDAAGPLAREYGNGRSP